MGKKESGIMENWLKAFSPFVDG